MVLATPRFGPDVLGVADELTRTDRAYGKVTTRLGAERVNGLLVGAFEVDEPRVRPDVRGTGWGRRLLSALVDTAPGGRAWLLTWSQAHETLACYRRVGWREPDPLPGNETGVVVFLSPGWPGGSSVVTDGERQ
ncbi:GNAT family N-acetyltransferase [Streptomyces buecherae]|uniref:GNAT family N-acetyltransferase n=1 Tax=Streptomyces buecherae TaxID=2763006 RepID=UPI00340146EF